MCWLPSQRSVCLPIPARIAATCFHPADITAYPISLFPQDELHLLHVVPDVFTSPASGSIYYCSSPDPETERLLVRAPEGCSATGRTFCRRIRGRHACRKADQSCPCNRSAAMHPRPRAGFPSGPATRCACRASRASAPCCAVRLQWSQAKQFFVDNFLEHAKQVGLEDAVCLHLVKESRLGAGAAPPPLAPPGAPCSVNSCTRPP